MHKQHLYVINFAKPNLIIDILFRGYVFVFNNNKIDLSISGRHERYSKYIYNNSCAVVSYFCVFFLQLVVSLSRDYFFYSLLCGLVCEIEAGMNEPIQTMLRLKMMTLFFCTRLAFILAMS